MTIKVSEEYIASLRARLSEIQQARKGLEQEEKGIMRLLKLHGLPHAQNGPRRSVATLSVKTARNTKKPNTSELIREYVRAHPGCATRDVIDALIDQIVTSSSKPRRYLRSAVETLVRRKEIERYYMLDGKSGLRMMS